MLVGLIYSAGCGITCGSTMTDALQTVTKSGYNMIHNAAVVFCSDRKFRDAVSVSRKEVTGCFFTRVSPDSDTRFSYAARSVVARERAILISYRKFKPITLRITRPLELILNLSSVRLDPSGYFFSKKCADCSTSIHST